MSLPTSPPETVTVIRLPPQCSTAAAIELSPELTAAASSGAPIVINGAAVETVGQAMMQLLLATKATRPDLRFEGASQALRDSIRLCALNLALGFDEEEI